MELSKDVFLVRNFGRLRISGCISYFTIREYVYFIRAGNLDQSQEFEEVKEDTEFNMVA